MITLRPSLARGHANHGWLDSWHSFSFAGYQDPAHMGWGNLRVINEDRIAPGAGFGRHGHRDMEIISVVLSGELAHQDSLGNIETIPAGDVQRMSAGTGVMHSEFNHAADRETHFLQIWMEPAERGIAPGYEQRAIAPSDKRGRLCLLAAPPRTPGAALAMHADARLHAGLFDQGEQAELALDPGRKGYVHVVRGEVRVNGLALAAGDAAKLSDESRIILTDGREAEVLVFDLAA
jgi:redox-sensitive bicupin YhaK (pirin superfamily)